MKPYLLKSTIIVMIIVCATITACSTNSTDVIDEKEKLAEIAALLDIEFPADARMIYTEKNDRSNKLAFFYIVHTATPVQFKKPLKAKIPPESSIESLKRANKKEKYGKLKDQWAYIYEGEMKKGSWRANQTHFDSGSYLRVELFFF